MAINWIVPQRGRSSGANSTKHYCYITDTSNKSKVATIIGLSSEMMKDARFVCGDRINVGFDDDYLYLKRAITGGYALGAAGKGGEAREKALGTVVRSNIKITGKFVEGKKCLDKSDITINQDGIICIPRT